MSQEQGKIKITLSAIEELLEQGFTRPEIAAHFGISRLEVGKLFQHPKLKNRKPKKAVSFEFIDDSEEEIVEKTAPSVAETTEESATFEPQSEDISMNNPDGEYVDAPEDVEVETVVEETQEVVEEEATQASDDSANEDWDNL